MWHTVLEIGMRVLLVIGYLVGLLCIPLGLSGTFILLGVSALYDLAHGFQVIGWPMLLVFLGLCVVGEIIEAVLGSLLAIRYGAGKWGAIASFVGGILGATLGTSVAPVIGTVVGSFVGAFLGAFLAETAVRARQERAMEEGARAGWGAFLGKIAAVGVKMAIGAAIIAVSLTRILG